MYLQGGTFLNFYELTSITIPSSVLSIGQQVFGNCSKLGVITYIGTIADWNAINLDWQWNSYTNALVIHCLEGDLSYEANWDYDPQ